jgi:hypothetical protein
VRAKRSTVTYGIHVTPAFLDRLRVRAAANGKSLNAWCVDSLADAADLEELAERDDVEAQERFERARRAWWLPAGGRLL